MPAATRSQHFRAALKPGAALILPGVATALAARVVADCGFSAAYVTGAGIANSFLGIPDNGLVTLTELADHVGAIREVFAGPLMVDADTGLATRSTCVAPSRRWSAPAPMRSRSKTRCSPSVAAISKARRSSRRPRWSQKIKAAVDARRDPGLMIVARTDAIAVEGFNAAIDRAHAFREAGADVGFIEAPVSTEQIATIATPALAAAHQRGDRRQDAGAPATTS